MLSRIERHFGIPGFASSFKADFEAFLQSVDTDTTAAGLQPYVDPNGQPILTLAATRFFGPAQTWPRELYNHPYIEFWHRLDAALVQAALTGMGPEVLGDEAWRSLFQSGVLAEDPSLRSYVWIERSPTVSRLQTDQLGATRAEQYPADIGAVEMP